MTAPDGRPRQRTVPLDPDSPKGREVAARLTHTLAVIQLEIAARKRAAAREAGADRRAA